VIPTKARCKRCRGPTFYDPSQRWIDLDSLGSEFQYPSLYFPPYCPECAAAWSQMTCVVCERHFLVDVLRHKGGHHCEPGLETRVEASRKSHSDLGRLQSLSYADRLTDGFRMLPDFGEELPPRRRRRTRIEREHAT
jgi:hypothetical protein